MDWISSNLSAFNVNVDTLPPTFTVIKDGSKVVDVILAPINESCLAIHDSGIQIFEDLCDKYPSPAK